MEYEYSKITCNSISEEYKLFYYSLSLHKKFHGIKKLLFKFHTSKKINRIVKLPFKSVWAPSVLDNCNNIQKDDIVCFIYQGGDNYFDIGVFPYLKKHFPNSILIYNYNDLVELNERLYPGFLNKCKATFDIIMTFNPLDSKAFGIELHPPVFPRLNYLGVDNKNEYDVFFVGKDKGRLALILKIYELMVAHGLKCEFYITDVEKERQLYSEKIHYNVFLPYEDVLKKVSKTKSVLNIIQEGSCGITLRDYECITFKKMLLTNNTYLTNTKYYDANKVLFINEDIPFEKIKNYKDSSWNITGDCSAKSYITWINELIDVYIAKSKKYEK